jgi:Na+/melibiose symporter-like transporter
MGLLYGRAGRLNTKNGGFRPGQWLTPVQFTYGVLTTILLPHDVAELVGAEEKGRYLGIAVTIMGWIQLCQPILGSISDNTRSKYGRRRPYVVLGQLLSVAALCTCFIAKDFWTLAAGFELYQLGNAISYSTYCSILPAVHTDRRGTMAGVQNVCGISGFLFGSLLGYSIGAGDISRLHAYVLMVVINAMLAPIGYMALSATVGGFGAELNPPPLAGTSDASAAKIASTTVAAAATEMPWSGRGRCLTAVLGFFDAFKAPMFRWLFLFALLGAVGSQIGPPLTEYFFHDIVQPHGYDSHGR